MLPYCSEVTAVKFSWVDVVMLGFEGVHLLVLLQKTYVKESSSLGIRQRPTS